MGRIKNLFNQLCLNFCNVKFKVQKYSLEYWLYISFKVLGKQNIYFKLLLCYTSVLVAVSFDVTF